MRKLFITLIALIAMSFLPSALEAEAPWKHGKLQVSANKHYLQHEDGIPFFWLGETGWLLPQRLIRDEASFYLSECQKAGYNVVQIQVLNAVPSFNMYGAMSHPDGYDFSTVDQQGYGYWQHMDYLVKTAERFGIYVGMVCIWGNPVKTGKMSVEEAKAYGSFLANRYKDSPNVIWIIGGDVRGEEKEEVWTTLASTIRAIDATHLMTFHPRGRTSSVKWFNQADWLDFNMFQSGHRRYGQRKPNEQYEYILPDTEEDNWRYVEAAWKAVPVRPVLDGEPSYEGIPQGLHDATQPRWKAADCRRYAWWSVLSGACGHTYGNNSIMQFYRPGLGPAYGCDKPWYEALHDPGFNQMHHLKDLILRFPYFDREPDQSLLVGEYGEKYDLPRACRGKDYILVYTYTGAPLTIDMTKISGKRKHAWWYNPADGSLVDIGSFDNNAHQEFRSYRLVAPGNDNVLIVMDENKHYLDQ